MRYWKIFSQPTSNYLFYDFRNSASGVVYEPVSGTQILPSNELIRELEELSLNKVSSPSPVPSDTASSRASNNTPELHNPVIDFLTTLDNVQGIYVINTQTLTFEFKTPLTAIIHF